jgi:hypothetical protein
MKLGLHAVKKLHLISFNFTYSRILENFFCANGVGERRTMGLNIAGRLCT